MHQCHLHSCLATRFFCAIFLFDITLHHRGGRESTNSHPHPCDGGAANAHKANCLHGNTDPSVAHMPRALDTSLSRHLTASERTAFWCFRRCQEQRRTNASREASLTNDNWWDIKQAQIAGRVSGDTETWSATIGSQILRLAGVCIIGASKLVYDLIFCRRSHT